MRDFIQFDYWRSFRKKFLKPGGSFMVAIMINHLINNWINLVPPESLPAFDITLAGLINMGLNRLKIALENKKIY